MKYTVETITDEFSPKEAASISGVSTVLQRDWRRRGVLPDRQGKKWSKFTLSNVIQMTVMRAFTKSGISLESAETLSHMAILPVLDTFSRRDDVSVFIGDPLNEEQESRIRRTHVSGASEDDQFSFVALPESESGTSAARLSDLSRGEMIMSQNNSFHGIVVDHNRLAHHIAEKASLPIIRFHVKIIEGAS